MEHTINFTSVGLILLDAMLIWSCWAVDKYLKLEPVDDD